MSKDYQNNQDRDTYAYNRLNQSMNHYAALRTLQGCSTLYSLFGGSGIAEKVLETLSEPYYQYERYESDPSKAYIIDKHDVVLYSGTYREIKSMMKILTNGKNGEVYD